MNPADEGIYAAREDDRRREENEQIRRAIEIIDRANSRVASLATEMVETLAKNEQHPCEKLDALKDAIQHRHRAYDSLYKAISGKGNKPKLKTYPATVNGKTVQVTIPED